MDNATKNLFKEAYAGNLEAVNKAILEGADINAADSNCETPLMAAISSPNDTYRLDIVKLLLEKGANADYRGEENCGVLFQAVLLKDAEITELILKAGADPNIIMESGETLYDYSEFNYRYDAYDLKLPIEPLEQNKTSEESWLSYLDLCAQASGTNPPTFLRVLRKYGAKSKSELRNT